MNRKLIEIRQLLKTLNAILILEHYNKNHLAMGTKPNLLNENQREIVETCLELLQEIEEMDNPKKRNVDFTE